MTTALSKMPESCSNYPPTRSKVLQSSSDNPAILSEKYAMNKLNTATNTLTETSDTLTVGTHSENSANRSENSGSHSEHFAGRSEHSVFNAKNIQPGSYVVTPHDDLASCNSVKTRPAGLLFNKRLVFLFTKINQ